MTTRLELNAMLAAYETYIGGGNMKQAGRLLPKIIRAVVTFVEERTPDHVEAEHSLSPKRLSLNEIVSDLRSKSSEPCAPCDVSLANNAALIEVFKEPVIAAETAEEAEDDEEGIEMAEVAATEAAEGQTEEPVANATTETETVPVKEPVAPAPKTPKKPKAST